MKAKLGMHQGKMEAAIYSVQFELEKTVKRWVDDVHQPKDVGPPQRTGQED
jgi:hypothetical protein